MQSLSAQILVAQIYPLSPLQTDQVGPMTFPAEFRVGDYQEGQAVRCAFQQRIAD